MKKLIPLALASVLLLNFSMGLIKKDKRPVIDREATVSMNCPGTGIQIRFGG